jgi:putative hemolysin
LIGDATEYDQQEYTIVQRDDNSWLADGQYPFFELLNYFDLPEKKNTGDYNTLGGLILNLINHIPTTGEKVKWDKFEIEVLDMDGNRIDKVLISKV